MQHKLRCFISVLLFAVIVLNGVAITNQKAYAATPQQVNDALDKFIGAVGKFGATDATANIGKIANFCNRLGGLTSAASGVIGFLQMMGVIKDPTTDMLGQILDSVKNVQTTLDNMNKTLNGIAQELLRAHVDQKWDARNAKATTMSTNWNRFKTDYTEKLERYVKEYEAKINSGIKAWWEQASHEGVYVLMRKEYGWEDSLTYSKKKYSEGLPSKSDINNETVNTEWSIGIPAECMPNTRAVTFNIDTYRDDFKYMMVTALEDAIRNDKLASNCGATLKNEYFGRYEYPRHVMMEDYADYVLNTVTYKIACDVMTAENVWVADVISLYKQFCDNILQRDSGIDAFLNYIYLTHAFEGEVRSDIERFMDGMTAQTGLYGQFVLTCAGQDSLQTTATKEKIQEYFVNTVTSLDNRKKNAIKGKDNYCYITGTILEADSVKFSVDAYAHRTTSWPCEQNVYTGCDGYSWNATIPSIVDSVYLPMIYNQYLTLKQGANSFGAYLHKYGAQKDDSNKTYMTQYVGQQDFAFSEGIRMQAHQLIKGTAHPWFRDNGWYNIDVGTGSKVEQKYYAVHDKVVGYLFHSDTGRTDPNATICARAFYGEHNSAWQVDEFWAFHTEGVTYWTSAGYKDDLWVHMVSRTIDILKSETCHDLNGDEVNNPENPFFAFDMASLVPGVSDLMGIQYENTSKDITEVLLDSESFAYTGQPIEPAVTVLASDDLVPVDGYTVTYINNIESGDSAVVRVQGVGDYAGVITRHFTITENASSGTSHRKSSGGGCNALSSVGVVLGLAFVIRKFRRH